jgi:hypothetical protein
MLTKERGLEIHHRKGAHKSHAPPLPLGGGGDLHPPPLCG